MSIDTAHIAPSTQPELSAHQSASPEHWRKTTYRYAVEKAGERQPQFTTTCGLDVAPLYTTEDLAGWDPTEQLGYPGEHPYPRGIQPTMYRGRLWTMRQYAGFGITEESNQRYHYLLEHGTTGLSVAFDLPTQMGYDADAEPAEGEVGKVGVSISSLEDMRPYSARALDEGENIGAACHGHEEDAWQAWQRPGTRRSG